MNRFKYKVWKGPTPDYCVCTAGPPSHSWICRELRIPSTLTALILASGSPIRNIQAICLFHQSGILLLPFIKCWPRHMGVFRKPHHGNWVWTQCRSWEMYYVATIRHSFLLILVPQVTLIHYRQERVSVSRAPGILSCCLGHSTDVPLALCQQDYPRGYRVAFLLPRALSLYTKPELCCTRSCILYCPGKQLCPRPRSCCGEKAHGTLFALSPDWCGGLWRVCSVGSLL